MSFWKVPGLFKVMRSRPNDPQRVVHQIDPQMDARIKSMEAQETLARLAFAPELCGKIDVGGEPEERLKLIEHTRKVWSDYGDTEPFFSVLTHDEFKMEALTPESEKAFFEGGVGDANLFLEACERNGLSPQFDGTIIDFGCGLGRIGEHLARRFQTYIGVDISPSHLARAEDRFSKVGLRNARFILLQEYLDNPIQSNAFFSKIVLQQNPPPMIAMMLNNLCSMLLPEGIAYFQVPTA
jgi:SAM-dependent methyltransferase